MEQMNPRTPYSTFRKKFVECPVCQGIYSRTAWYHHVRTKEHEELQAKLTPKEFSELCFTLMLCYDADGSLAREAARQRTDFYTAYMLGKKLD